MLPLCCQHGNGVEPRPVMMKLALDAAVLGAGAENKIPVTARAAVVPPMRDGRIVAEDRVESDIGLVLIFKVFCPSIHLFLTGRIPRHLTTEWVRFFSPTVGARTHPRLQLVRLLLHAFAFEVGKNLKEDVTFHLAEYGEALGIFRHGD